MVPPNGVSFARSGSTWIHWWSPVASAKASMSFWVTSCHSETPSSSPSACLSSLSPVIVRMGGNCRLLAPSTLHCWSPTRRTCCTGRSSPFRIPSREPRASRSTPCWARSTRRCGASRSTTRARWSCASGRRRRTTGSRRPPPTTPSAHRCPTRWRGSGRARQEGPDDMGPDAVLEAYGVTPEQVPDFIALRGDPSDGLPGAKGIGAKTAADLLKRKGDLEHVILGAVREKPAVRRALIEQADELRSFRDIATLRTVAVDRVEDRPTDYASGAAAASELGLGRLAERLGKAAED